MKLMLLAFDSFSVRSMATYIESKINILIDPGIAIGPSRYGLAPSKYEWKALDEGRKKIINYLKSTQVITISHYHFDHHPFYDDHEFNQAAYKDKIVFTKSTTKINFSQKKRHSIFEKIAKPLAKELNYADNNEYQIKGVKIRFSKPVFHGKENSRLGYVVMVTVESEKRIMHCSDIQGPITKETTELIINENPDILIIGGPPTYFLGWRFSTRDLNSAIQNLKKILDNTDTSTIILDHHLLRDLKYRERINLFGNKVITAAEFLNIKIKQLEARRRELS